MNELMKIRKLQKKYEDKLQNRLSEIFNKLIDKEIDINAFDLKELTSKVLKKPYITDKEKRLIMGSIAYNQIKTMCNMDQYKSKLVLLYDSLSKLK